MNITDIISNDSKSSGSSNNSKSSRKSTNSKNSKNSRKRKTKKKKKRKKKIIKTILTRRGYALVKEHFGFRETHKCKKALTVSPFVNNDYAAKPEPFPVYLESSRKMYLPRHFGIEHFGEPDKVKTIDKSFDIDLKFNGNLLENQ